MSSQTFQHTLYKFNEIIRGMISSQSFTIDDLKVPLNAIKHLHGEMLLEELERVGAIKAATDGAESLRELREKVDDFSIMDDGHVRITTKNGDDLVIATPTFREIVEKYVLNKQDDMYIAALVYLYVNSSSDLIAHYTLERLKTPFI